jgi:hypothetical protein
MSKFGVKETAIEIGKSCQLVLPEMELIILSSKTREEFIEKLEEQMTSYVPSLSFSFYFLGHRHEKAN